MLFKKNMCIATIFFMTIITASTAFSANYSVDISGLTDQNYADSIDSFTIWFEVDEFATSDFTLGDAVPTNGSMGWEIAKNAVVNNTVYKVDVYDQDGLFFSNPNYLTNGNMFTFEYTGTINELSYISFGDDVGNNLYDPELWKTTFNDSGAQFSAVPIPSTVLLLGFGLASLLGIRKKA